MVCMTHKAYIYNFMLKDEVQAWMDEMKEAAGDKEYT